MAFIVFIVSLAFVGWILYSALGKPRQKVLEPPAEDVVRTVLAGEVLFYKKLEEEERARFEKMVRRFLEYVTITGVNTTAEESDKVLVAAAAIIPVFSFGNWEYNNITEVLLYPGTFSKDFEQSGNELDILGMVGEGAMENTMILSREALRHGFMNRTDKHNTAIHEFIHLVDKMDGDVDGLPEVLMQHSYSVPWLKHIRQGIQKIHSGKSDINPYGATNDAEFFAVAGEYFFERPELMKQKHPELYELMCGVFRREE